VERSIELRSLLKQQRHEVLKISRIELAARSGVRASTIQAIEGGRVNDPGLFTVIALGIALQIDLGSMMRSLTGPIRPKPLNDLPTDAEPTGNDDGGD